MIFQVSMIDKKYHMKISDEKCNELSYLHKSKSAFCVVQGKDT